MMKEKNLTYAERKTLALSAYDKGRPLSSISDRYYVCESDIRRWVLERKQNRFKLLLKKVLAEIEEELGPMPENGVLVVGVDTALSDKFELCGLPVFESSSPGGVILAFKSRTGPVEAKYQWVKAFQKRFPFPPMNEATKNE